MKTYYAVIDTNVLVSAMLNRSSAPGEIIRNLLDGRIIPVLHTDIIVLNRPRFGWTKDVTDEIIGEIVAHGIFAERLSSDEFMPDPDDRIFYEVVMKKRETDDAFLITGNIKYFPIKSFVVTPRQMLDIPENADCEA